MLSTPQNRLFCSIANKSHTVPAGALTVNYPDEGFVEIHLDVGEQNSIVGCLTFSELEQNSRDLMLNRKKISALKCD